MAPLSRTLLAAVALAVACLVTPLRAQTADTTVPAGPAGPARGDSSPRPVPVPAPESHFHRNLILGFVTSILAHEAGHVVAAYAVGGHPTFGLNKGRPTVYSGVDAQRHPTKQFIFSSAGLDVQMLLNEAILDLPHRRGGAFQRGLLAGGIATVLFYITIGRNGTVSDIEYMARTSRLSKTQVSLIYGGIAASQVVRIHLDKHYAHFFAAPSPDGRLRVGMVVR